MPGADLTVHYPDRAIMQYGDNYGYLKYDQLVVLQPHQSAKQFHYDVGAETLTPVPLDPTLDKLALAHALWPSWAYFNQRYVLPPAAMQRAAAAPPATAASAAKPVAPIKVNTPDCCVTRQL
jgi:hypothetical protein